MHPANLRELALKLRKQGFSYSYISGKTGLSKSTLSGWLSEIPYVPNREMTNSLGKAIVAANVRKMQIRQKELEFIRRQAEKDIGRITKRELFVFGLGLYLGEGGKTHNVIRVINADPQVIRAAVEWFKALGVRRDQFAPRIHLYPDNDIEASLQFWSRTTRIPITQFHQTQVDRRTDKKSKKHGKLPFGTLHLGIRSNGRKAYGVLFFRKIQAWNEIVLKEIWAGVV